jgi:hypothetical protein
MERCKVQIPSSAAVLWEAVTSEFLWNVVGNHGAPGRKGVRWPTVDGLVQGNQLSAAEEVLELTGVHNIIANNFIFNSARSAGLRLSGARNTIVGNRFDENERSGLLIDDGGAGGVTTNIVTGNQFHTNGVFADAPIRAGVEIRGTVSHNSITGNTFDNFCQTATICDNQDYGIAILDMSHSNAIVGNTFFDQNRGGILNSTSGANVIVGNAGQA